MNRRQFLKRSALLAGLAFISPSKVIDEIYSNESHIIVKKASAGGWTYINNITVQKWAEALRRTHQKQSFFHQFQKAGRYKGTTIFKLNQRSI